MLQSIYYRLKLAIHIGRVAFKLSNDSIFFIMDSLEDHDLYPGADNYSERRFQLLRLLLNHSLIKVDDIPVSTIVNLKDPEWIITILRDYTASFHYTFEVYRKLHWNKYCAVYEGVTGTDPV